MFCRMREETYGRIPKPLRDEFISERVILPETEEMKADEMYSSLKRNYYKAKEELEKRKFELKYPA